MARLLALEWDEREARVAVANVRREATLLEQAFTVSLHPERTNQTPAEIGAKLGAALSARGISSRLECLVAVGRSSIELRHLTLPPSPADELPDLVRFQALREFNTLGDEWPLDFLPISGSETEPRNVLAAAISPELVKQIDTTLTAAGQKPERLILRACAAAALLRRQHPSSTEKVRLLVDLLIDEADLTILENDQVVFLRTARLPGEPGSPEQARALVAETRRTMVAAQNRLGGGRVEAVFLCGNQQSQQLAGQMQTDLSLPVRVFQPFEGLACSAELQAALPADAGRFAPLLGLLLDEASETPHALDFLHPHKRPAPPSNRRKYTFIGAAAAAVLLMIGGWIWLRLSSLDGEVADLSKQLTGLNQQATTLTSQFARVENRKQIDGQTALNTRVNALDVWQMDDIDWLSELRNLSVKFLPSKDAMVTSFALSRVNNIPAIGLDVLMKSSGAKEQLEQALRGPKHYMVSKGVEARTDKSSDNNPATKQYDFHMKSSVEVKK